MYATPRHLYVHGYLYMYCRQLHTIYRLAIHTCVLIILIIDNGFSMSISTTVEPLIKDTSLQGILFLFMILNESMTPQQRTPPLKGARPNDVLYRGVPLYIIIIIHCGFYNR